ncbi:MAG: RNA polymerase sigma factor SigJ [Kofleriaceae bacterium]|nr:RNA polymerase sigma factor SigJ [Kofleriaceae bacterium]
MTPEVLERERPYLRGVAYRLLGSAADADDMVQEALVRGAAIDDAQTPRALLTTIVTRLCLDELRSARRRRERYVGPWLPEPVLTPDAAAAAPGPADHVGAAESVSMAFLVLLEALTPDERAVFVLREALDVDFADIAAAVGKSEAACRQLLHRARGHVAAGRRRFAAPDQQARLAGRFLGALAAGDVAAMVELLVDDARSIADHGGKAQAARREVVGAARVARLLCGLAGKAAPLGFASRPAWINGNPALIVSHGDVIHAAVVLDVALVDGAPRVVAVHIVRNPDKLGAALPLLQLTPP